MPVLAIWSSLGEPLDDYLWLIPNMNLCYSESIPNTWQMDLQPFTKAWCQAGHRGNDCAAANSDSQLRKHSLLVGRCYQGRLCLALSSSLLTVRFPANVMKDNFWYSRHELFLSLFQDPLKRLTLSGNQQSLNLKRWEAAPSSFQD